MPIFRVEEEEEDDGEADMIGKRKREKRKKQCMNERITLTNFRRRMEGGREGTGNQSSNLLFGLISSQHKEIILRTK